MPLNVIEEHVFSIRKGEWIRARGVGQQYPQTHFPGYCIYQVLTGLKNQTRPGCVSRSFWCTNYPVLFPPSKTKEESFVSLAARVCSNWIHLWWKHDGSSKRNSNEQEVAQSSQLWEHAWWGCSGAVGGWSLLLWISHWFQRDFPVSFLGLSQTSSPSFIKSLFKARLQHEGRCGRTSLLQ